MVDKLKIEQAVRLLLEGIGEDITREGLIDTPDRIARMCEEIYGGLGHEADQHLLKQFPVENNEIVLEKDITFYSMCEHHLMPFYGKAHLAYIPNGKVTGLSKLARTVEVYSRRPQIQERLTVQIADALERTLDPKGIMVMHGKAVDFLLDGRPHQHIIPAHSQHPCKGHAPGASAQNTNTFHHVCPPYPPRSRLAGRAACLYLYRSIQFYCTRKLLSRQLLCRSAQSQHLFFVHFVYTMQFFETICVHFQIML